MRRRFPGSAAAPSSLSIIILAAAFIATASADQLPPFSCDKSDPRTSSLGFCNTSLPIRQRVNDLASRLTLDEKISQLVNSAPAIPRLGIPAYQWWSEALHGVSGYGLGVSFDGKVKSATSFPQVILSAATFDSSLWYRIGQAVGKEARAMYNEGQTKGATFWAPNVNVFRDPRWGRGQETAGEDPAVGGRYAAAFVRGFQGNRRGLLQASACCKHFTAYDLENWKSVQRTNFNAIVTAQDMADTYQPPFKSCVEQGRASGIMCSYNEVNGVPNCANYNLLTRTAREEWGFQGYIVSDCNVVQVIQYDQHYTKSPEDAVADVLKAGMDVECGSYLQSYTKSAIDRKKLSVNDVGRAFHNLMSVRMRLGLFNGDPSKQFYGNVRADQVCNAQHQQLALDAARNGIVLLKNDDKLLPLRKSTTSTLAVIGPNGNSAYNLLGNYEGRPCKSVEVFKAVQAYVGTATFRSGCNFVNCTSADIGGAVEAAKRADYVVLVMGLDQGQEGEGRDRLVLSLPGQQENLVAEVAKAAKKPVVLVLLCGGPVDVSFAKRDRKIGSILWAGYPGEAGGLAIAEIIFGLHNPGGKLPMTWYPKDFEKVPMTDMRMRPDPTTNYPGRTYRFYQGPKVFEFGHGLSFTTYSYRFMPSTSNIVYFNHSRQANSPTTLPETPNNSLLVSSMDLEFCAKSKFLVVVGVENVGEMAGKHPVLLFAKHDGGRGRLGRPMKELVGFRSVSLGSGERGEVEFELSPCEHFSTVNRDGLMVVEEGYVNLVVGDEEFLVNIVI